MPALISTIENFLDIHGIATKSGNVSPNLLENKIPKKVLARISLVAYDQIIRRHFSSNFGVFFSIFLQILTKYFKQSVILSLESFMGHLWNISSFARDLHNTFSKNSKMAAICFVLCQILKHFLVNLYLKRLGTNTKSIEWHSLHLLQGI